MKMKLTLACAAMTLGTLLSPIAHSDTSPEMTADQQGNSKRDIAITQTIRQNIIKNKSLSVDAHNVKIITQNGKVLLKGPVQSSAERAAIDQQARLAAGAQNVHDQLLVVRND